MNYTAYTDPPRIRPGRPYSEVRATRAERVMLAVAKCPGQCATQLADAVSLHPDHVRWALTNLHAQGLVRFERHRVTVGNDTRERRLWYAVALVSEIETGRDHPGTLLGQIRAALAERPHTVRQLARRISLSEAVLRTVCRVLVLQGDLRRIRGKIGERYALPLDVLDDDDEVAA